ncbi:hypothetical protein [Methanobrevibacter arboriphilus]|uniref:hypothetical protein n=1 Tax=Methanobrevibacter arboriphilus TaxID=39441 RepID=UPI0005B255D5|nr:hypothetical protein [Methanobrevibacter arboriphilus]
MWHVFKVSNKNIIKHLNNIFEYRELNKEEMSFNPTIQLIVESCNIAMYFVNIHDYGELIENT